MDAIAPASSGVAPRRWCRPRVIGMAVVITLGLRSTVRPRVLGAHQCLPERARSRTQRAIASYMSEKSGVPAEEAIWTKRVGHMHIVVPVICWSARLAWLRSRRRPNQTTDTTQATEQATRDNYAAEEQSRREGTDDR